MNDRNRPLPLSEVLEIVERRRRQRARTGAIAGSALAVGAAGMAGLIVVGLQAGPSGVTPAAPPPAPALVTATPTTAPTTAPVPAALPPPFDSYRDPDFLANLADAYPQFPEPDQDRILGDAAELAEVWGLEHYPAAKAVAVKAEGTGTGIDPGDPRNADELVGRFERAGYTERDADELARAWATDPRTAKIVGALVLEAN